MECDTWYFIIIKERKAMSHDSQKNARYTVIASSDPLVLESSTDDCRSSLVSGGDGGVGIAGLVDTMVMSSPPSSTSIASIESIGYIVSTINTRWNYNIGSKDIG